MRRKMLVVVLLTTFILGCSPPNEKPTETKESSVFQCADVQDVVVTSDGLNVRGGKGTQFPIIGHLNKGEQIHVLGKIDDWYIIHLPNDLVGCIASKYVKPYLGKETTNQIQKATRLKSEEAEMIRLVNQERGKEDLDPLIVDMELTKVARIKSEDMAEHHYFSHNSPTYGNPFDMLNNLGIDYLYAGENLAGNSGVGKAMNALMNSKGHRENILSKDYTHIGIGVTNSDTYGFIFTQLFINKSE